MLIALDNITKDYGSGVVLSQVSCQIEPGQRIGLIGANGAGKSTLLSILQGTLSADSGEIFRCAGLEIGFLKQDGGLESDNDIWEEMHRPFSRLLEIEQRIRTLQEQMASLSDHQSEGFLQLSEELAQKQSFFEQQDGYNIDVKIKTVLGGMGFREIPWDTNVNRLSGGERTRLALCKLLLSSPSLLMLDEPTNHLDFVTLEWLEDYLKTYGGALVLVSHDRYFLDVLCSHIWEIEHTKLQTYKGNYTAYVPQKQARVAYLQKMYDAWQEQREKLEDYVARNLTRASTSNMAKSRRTALEKMEVAERPKLPPKPPHIVFDAGTPPVSDVLLTKHLSVFVGEGAGQRQLLDKVEFSMKRGERMAFIGANGIGKTSLFRALQDKTKQSRQVFWGRGVRVGAFVQDDRDMQGTESALDWLWKRFPRLDQLALRSMLGQLRISGEDVFKSVRALSGGQRARLKFACLMLESPNVLLLDEPTNHLDLETREVLEEALCAYEGTVLVISHDRYLLGKVPHRIAAFEEHSLHIYNGTFEDYRKQRARLEQAAAAVVSPKEKQGEKLPQTEPSNASSGGSHRSKEQRRLAAKRQNDKKRVEGEVQRLEQEISQLEEKISDPALGADYEELNKCCERLEAARAELDEVMEEWILLEDD